MPIKATDNSLQNPFLFAGSDDVVSGLRQIQTSKKPGDLLKMYVEDIESKGSKRELFYVCAVGGIILAESGDVSNAASYLFKAVDIGVNIRNVDNLLGQAYFWLGKVCYETGNVIKAEEAFDASSFLLNAKKTKNYLPEVNIQQGILNIKSKNYKEAIKIFNSAIRLAKDSGSELTVADANYYKGKAYRKRGDYDMSIASLVTAQKAYAKLNMERGICQTIVEMADISMVLGDYNHALTLYYKAMDNCQSSDLYGFLASCYLKIGKIYMFKQQMEDALDYLDKYKDVCINASDTLGIIKSKIALGAYYAEERNFPRAIIVLHEAAELLNKYPDVSEEGQLMLLMSQVYVKTDDLYQAKSYAQKALVIASTLDEMGMKADCYKVFADLYELQGDYRSAYYYQNRRGIITDSLLNKEAVVALRKISGLSTSTKDKRVIEELEQENISLNNYWLKEKNKSYLLWGATILLFVFTIVLFGLFKAKAKVEKKLKTKNTELEKLNATKDKFFSIIAHDLKSPFNSLMGFSEMLSLHAESKSHKDIMEYSKIIHNSTRKLFSLVDTLLQWSRTQLGTTDYKPERLEVGIVTSNIVSILKINAEEKDIVISIDIPENTIAWADKDLYSAVLRNLIGNAIKFSRVGSVITVSAKIYRQFVEVAVTDTGVGITKENLKKIFSVDSNVSTQGTFNEKGTGLGLVLCKEFVEINRGQIWAESKLEKGSTFKFTLPLVKS
ncbi:tetratricopeptide repeat-containing sensor histidine kinase [Plebeiibacterium marinum]|uniref:histidine kinase n=1 Tax=Plebeiibacterium marinum TaxID=2992111 RepID=A0AAE3MGC1_9BACT|nr:ATP-binding protein [Plebeiobacterium marinum]MCW3807221.1 ATP-binding protein [Plebeiobacterium marinum]